MTHDTFGMPSCHVAAFLPAPGRAWTDPYCSGCTHVATVPATEVSGDAQGRRRLLHAIDNASRNGAAHIDLRSGPQIPRRSGFSRECRFSGNCPRGKKRCINRHEIPAFAGMTFTDYFLNTRLRRTSVDLSTSGKAPYGSGDLPAGASFAAKAAPTKARNLYSPTSLFNSSIRCSVFEPGLVASSLSFATISASICARRTILFS